MRNCIYALAGLLLLASCEKTTETKEQKTAYIDTNLLLKEYTAATDIEAKYKEKSHEMSKELDVELARFKAEADSFKANAQANGPAWAQQKGSELRQREQQLTYAQQALVRQLQEEGGTEMDTLVSQVKKFIQGYGKEKGYAYIYGTGEAATILYAEEKYDITKEIIKLLNDKYKSEGKKEDANPAPAKPATK